MCWTLDRNVIRTVCGSTCAASARCVATSQLFPTLRLTVPVSNDINIALIDLVDHSDAFLIVAVIPSSLHSKQRCLGPRRVGHSCPGPLHHKASNTQSEPGLYCLSRFVCLLALHPYPHNPSFWLFTLFTLFMTPISSRRQGPKYWETTAQLKKAALRLLDRLARDALEPARKEGYNRIATIMEDTIDSRTPWTADIFVTSIDTDYSDKLGWSPSLPFLTSSIQPCSTLQLVCLLPLTTSSRRPSYLRYQRKSFYHRWVAVQAVKRILLASTARSHLAQIVSPPKRCQWSSCIEPRQ